MKNEKNQKTTKLISFLLIRQLSAKMQTQNANSKTNSKTNSCTKNHMTSCPVQPACFRLRSKVCLMPWDERTENLWLVAGRRSSAISLSICSPNTLSFVSSIGREVKVHFESHLLGLTLLLLPLRTKQGTFWTVQISQRQLHPEPSKWNTMLEPKAIRSGNRAGHQQ